MIGKESVRKLVESIEHHATCAPEQILVYGQMITGASVRNIT